MTFSSVFTVLWIGFCHTGPISLCMNLSVCFCFILHSCSSIIVSTVWWTWWDWILILMTYLPSVLWHCWSVIWPVKPVLNTTYGGTLNLTLSVCLWHLFAQISRCICTVCACAAERSRVGWGWFANSAGLPAFARAMLCNVVYRHFLMFCPLNSCRSCWHGLPAVEHSIGI